MADNVIVRVPEQQFIRGEDGYSPEVTIENIEHGHSVTITDREHPEGQSFDVLDGASAYEQAVAGGYEGTEAQFNEDLTNFKTLHDETEEVAPFYAEYGVTTKAEIAAAINGKRQIYAYQSLSPYSPILPYVGKIHYADETGSGTGYRFALTEGRYLTIFELTSSWNYRSVDLEAPAQRAEAAADQALIRMNSADTSAQEASASATAASQAEGNAANSATAAAGSATAAAGSASTASTAATTAQGHATNAASSATAASGSATSAASSATAAGNAQTAAETAQAAAEDAQEAAEAVLASIPADYTELTEDVADLKSAFNGNLVAKPFDKSIVKGAYIRSDTGSTASNAKYARTGLQLGYRQRVAVSLSDPNYEFRLSVYDETAQVIGTTGYHYSTQFSTGTQYVPQDCAKFGISFRRVDEANISDEDITAIKSALTFYSPTDTTLSIEFAAADAKATGDAVGELRSDFNMFETRNVLQTQLVRNRYIKGSGNGAGTQVPGNNFVSTKTLIAGYGEKISIELTDPTYEYYVSYYGENGALDGTGYIGYSGYNSGVFVIPEQAKKIGITFRRVDLGDLTSEALTEISNSLYFYGVTDISLSLSGKAADAKATGIAIENSSIYWSDDTNYLIKTYDALIAKYDALCLLYPQYITKNTLTSGDFTNYEYVLTIGNYNSQNGYRGQDAEIAKPTILISSGVHGYEQSSVMGLYGFVKAMCENVTSLNKIIYAAEYRIIPIACPSGYTNDSRVNSNGVNINRNFATTDWTLLPTGDDYSGAEPADQPETKVMQAWIEDHNDALLYIDWHNSGRLNEISCLLGINTTETAKWKKKYLTSINRVIPWWMKGRNIPPSNIYAYTGGPTAGYSNTGTAVTYAREHNIETAFVLETSWNVMDAGKHSKFSLGVGLEAFANMLIGFADLINESIN